MYASERALLADMIDYAGLFPPARLSLSASIGNYVRYRRESEGWMLARFVCPVGALGELAPYLDELFNEEPPWRLCVLGRGGDTDAAFLDNLRLDLEAVKQFREQHQARAVVECVELRLPAGTAGPDGHRSAPRLLAKAREAFEAAQLTTLPRFYELPLTGDYRRTAKIVTHALSMLNRGRTPGARPAEDTRSPVENASRLKRNPADAKTRIHDYAGLKLRCGGLEPAAVPSVEQVATVIEESAGARVPLKFTAGLHHPTRQLDPCLGVFVHGFLNVFSAAILADALGLNYPDIVAVVEEEDPRQFRFSEESFAWSDAEVTVKEIEHARRFQAVSFGSCSFDEPRSELKEIGLL